MIVLSIGTDRKIFEEGSASRAKMAEYGKLFSELHIIVFTRKTHGFKPQKIADNVWVYPTESKRRIWYPFDARKLYVRELSGLKPNVITTQDPFETGIAGWLIRRIIRVPLHMQIHTDFMSRYFRRASLLNRIRVLIAKWLLPKAEAIRVVSDRIRDSLKKIDPQLAERTVVLPIWTDVDRFRRAPVAVDLHQKYPHFPFIILMASRLTPEKNIPFALRVFRNVVIKNPKAGLVIVGEGSDKRYLQGLALSYHLDRNVVFESWQEELASYYKTADLFLTTSLYEGYGLTLVEAAASGCPIISSDVGIASRLIEEGVTGFVCDIRHSECFEEKIMRIIKSADLKLSLKKASQESAERRVSEPKAEYLEKYKNMIERTAMASPADM